VTFERFWADGRFRTRSRFLAHRFQLCCDIW
jgi:hypothetical protein